MLKVSPHEGGIAPPRFRIGAYALTAGITVDRASTEKYERGASL